MNRYSDQALNRMAFQMREAKRCGDVKYEMVLMHIQMRTGLTITEIESRVMAYVTV